MGKIITHPEQPEMQVEVILASRTASAPTLYTVRARYPRIIHAEVMTHRTFSRNARSSRAVPANKMIREVMERPFVPWHWGKNQKGMQAQEVCNAPVRIFDGEIKGTVDNTKAWLWARYKAVNIASAFHNAGYHKQIVNRLLEPFMWIDVLITATDWDNFLWLRDHEDAEPHIRDLAMLLREALETADTQELAPGEWHLPYVPQEEKALIGDWARVEKVFDSAFLDVDEAARRISAARCARISYTPFDGDKRDWSRDMELYRKLVRSDRLHASPFEHQATPDEIVAHKGEWAQRGFHGNLTGWVQYRKMIENELGMSSARAG